MLKQIHIAILIIRVSGVLSNVEKVIFLAPASIAIPTTHPNLDDLSLDRISPLHSSLRTQLAAEFPQDNSPKGKGSWFLLDELEPGRRYETRICWAATQPTQFGLFPYTLKEVFETPVLISSLALYSESRQPSEIAGEKPRPGIWQQYRYSTESAATEGSSVLLLQVFSAADYFTTNKTLMKDVPPVDVDIILDSYIFNIFPKSLLPTAVYISVLAILGWFVSDFIWKQLSTYGHVSPAGQYPEYHRGSPRLVDDKKQR